MDTINPADVAMPDSSPASPKGQPVDLAPGDWDSLPPDLKWPPYQERDFQSPTSFSLDAPVPDAQMAATTLRNMGLSTNPSMPWDYPPPPSHSASTMFDPVQFMFHSQLLDLQAKYQQAKADIEEFMVWSKKMEKHTQEMNNTLVDLFRIIREPEFVRGILEKPAGAENDKTREEA
ncbi:hypothetical protein PG985_006705 [Apiospora marii]|uniref:uncharacterized protein n=1 Tax=Apiospora marii TaxID=335849 RepID=UPI00312F2F52